MRSCLPPLTPYGVKHSQPGICHALFTLQPKCVVIWFILDFDFIFRYLWNNHRVWNKGKPNLNHRLNRTIKYKLYLLMLAFRLLLRWKVLYVGCVLVCRNLYHGEIVSGVVLKFKRPRHSWWVFQTQIADNRISKCVICEPFTVLFSTLATISKFPFKAFLTLWKYFEITLQQLGWMLYKLCLQQFN